MPIASSERINSVRKQSWVGNTFPADLCSDTPLHSSTTQNRFLYSAIYSKVLRPKMSYNTDLEFSFLDCLKIDEMIYCCCVLGADLLKTTCYSPPSNIVLGFFGDGWE